MLVALVSAQRGQSLHMLDIQFMKEGDTVFEFALPEHIKQSHPGYKVPSVLLQAYPADQSLYVFTHLNEYLQRTKLLRGNETKLFLSHAKPHDTISRWIHSVMAEAVVDVTTFKPRSTRAAAASKAKSSSVPVKEILDTAGWSSERTFDRFCNKPVQKAGGFVTSAYKCYLCSYLHANMYGGHSIRLQLNLAIVIYLFFSCECLALKSHGIPVAVVTKQI